MCLVPTRPLTRLAAVCLLAAATLPATDLEDRYRLTVDRVLSGGPPRYNAELVLADAIPNHVRRFTRFSGDVSGRYIGALAAAALESGRKPPGLDELVTAALRLQKADGHFGGPRGAPFPQDSDMAMLWGNGRLLIGLLEYYKLSGRQDVLASATRMGDYLLSIAPVLNSPAVFRQFQEGKFAVGYICWTQTLEGLVELYQCTKKPAYLALARELAERNTRSPGQHSHGFLSTLRGILNLHLATGEARYLEMVEREVRGIRESGNVLVHGAVPEAFRPDIRRDEGCTESDWLRLNLALWRVRGEMEYLEAAERTLFNEYALNQFDSGDFGHRVFGPAMAGSPQSIDRAKFEPTGVTEGNARSWWCCTLHGLRGFPDVRAAVFRVKNGTLYYDLPVDGSLRDGALEIRARSQLNREARIVLEIIRGDGARRPLWIRHPSWVHGIELFLNGTRLAAEPRFGYLQMSHLWKPGDKVELRCFLRTRLEQCGDKVALFHGPWLLGVDGTASPFFFDEPATQNRLVLPPVRDGGDLELRRAARAPAQRFAVPVARFEIDYRPGGYSIQPAKALLRPIAEQTGMPATAWTFLFRAGGGKAEFADQDH